MAVTFSRNRAVCDALLGARRAIALTGAGISVASGIPDFRSPGGLWSRFPPERFACIEAFRERPEEFWRFNFELFDTLAGKQPNPAHRALAELEGLGLLATIATQNIDGLHQAAGSRSVIELHGSKERLRCLRCQGTVPTSSGVLAARVPPRCASCGAILKPDVVYFGELLPVAALEAAKAAAASCDLCLVIGTSGLVYPAAMLPEIAFEQGAMICELNLEATSLTHSGKVRHLVEGPVEASLPDLLALVRTRRSIEGA